MAARSAQALVLLIGEIRLAATCFCKWSLGVGLPHIDELEMRER